MRTKWQTAGFFPALLAGLALVAAGCAESTTERDVADAREDLREEQKETADAAREGQQEVADARCDAQPYTVNKPVTGEDAAEARQEVADAQHEAKQDLAEQKQDEAEAAIELRTAEQQLAATKARDAFVTETEKKLADAEARIDALKSSASAAEGTAKENFDRQIETLQGQHDQAEEALSNLKSAKLAEWQIHRRHVRTAMQQLDTNMNNIRR